MPILDRFSKYLTAIEYPKEKTSWNIAGILKDRNAYYKYDVFNCVDYTIIPKTGTIIFFPSELNHKILINTSKLTRISLAFNFLPIGKVGDTGDSVANIK